ncbi:mitochondrial import inner membrane translocase subunit TIM22-like [Heracleum sosnowskyi]|uniref:Mitochondrial import inner membrane translocase subunit TIM22-like n=1 Tax=Heracleum sosnowskyi TaxID=360622 RepID=A0AAD8N820_9APIA|nr:mitochondrial import inner membrane translocase subunit TIM22-like [Heracleum sosnowskyi]
MGETKKAVEEEQTKRICMKSTNGIETPKYSSISLSCTKFKTPSWSWLAIPLEDAVVTVKSAAKGGIFGAVFGYMTLGFPIDIPTEAPFMPYHHPQDFLSPLAWSRNFAILTGVNAGINIIMKRERGKEDLRSRMLAGFGSGAMFSLVSGFGAPCEVGNMVTQGLFWAVIRGGLFKVGEKFSKPPVEDSAEDVIYCKTRSLLSGLGFQNYEKNFKKGLLTDKTLPLLTDRALREVGIPPGPRLLILDRIQRSDTC